MTTFLTLVFTAVAILLILVVLVQRGRGGGLAGAFGSGGGSTSAFGTKTGDVFTWATVILFAVFMLLAIWLNMRFSVLKEDLVGVEKAGNAAAGAAGGADTRPSDLRVESTTATRPSTTSTAPAPITPMATPPASAPAPAPSTQPK